MMPPDRGTAIAGEPGTNGSRVVYILRSFPRLSQTFILNEVLALERLGVRVQIFPITNPREALVQHDVAEVRAPTHYLETALERSWAAILLEHLLVAASGPRRYLSTLAYVLRRRDLATGYAAASRLTCFMEAVYLARILRHERASANPSTHVHSHFAHDPTLIALLLKRLTGLRYSFTAHARDVFQVPRSALAERIREADAVLTCCHSNLEYLSELAPEERPKLQVMRYGIDLQTFRPAQAPQAHVPLMVSIGRLVEKKGFGDLIGACRMLEDEGLGFRCVVYGEGPLRDELVEAVASLELTGKVTFAGARTQRELQGLLKEAHLFALTPCVTDDGDRDGVPNALLEAMACGLPVVTTTVAGIPEVIVHGQNGLLAEPHDVPVIAGNLAALLTDPPLRTRLGARARSEVVANFDREANARRLASVLGWANMQGGESP
jgi:glycosyltransferase involved in cell wall biosynthesis